MVPPGYVVNWILFVVFVLFDFDNGVRSGHPRLAYLKNSMLTLHTRVVRFRNLFMWNFSVFGVQTQQKQNKKWIQNKVYFYNWRQISSTS